MRARRSRHTVVRVPPEPLAARRLIVEGLAASLTFAVLGWAQSTLIEEDCVPAWNLPLGIGALTRLLSSHSLLALLALILHRAQCASCSARSPHSSRACCRAWACTPSLIQGTRQAGPCACHASTRRVVWQD